MESIPALHIRKSELGRRNDEGRSRWLRLRRAALAGHVLTDPRNQEQRDLGIELVWRLRVARHYIEIMEGDVVMQRLTPDFAVDCDARNLDAGHTRKMTKSELAREFGEDNEK